MVDATSTWYPDTPDARHTRVVSTIYRVENKRKWTYIAGLALLQMWAVLGCRPEADSYRLPAEWEPHEAVWVPFFGSPVDTVALQLVAAIAPHVHVKAVVPRVDFFGRHNPRLRYDLRAALSARGVDPGAVTWVQVDSIAQTRDKGPIFVRNPAGELQVVDFRWNNYGHPAAQYPGFEDPYPFDTMMAERLGLPTRPSSLVMEGGALEVNGQGTLLQVARTTLQRNPGLGKAAIETELKRVLGQQKVIWLEDGLAEDPLGAQQITPGYIGSGVGGHIDEFCRFVDAHTILLAMPDSAQAARDPVKRLTRKRMLVNYEILTQATDQDGQPFEVITVPMPDVPYPSFVATATQAGPFGSLVDELPEVQPGDTLRWVPVSSYLNFFVTNGVVLVPAYGHPGASEAVREKDRRMQALLARFYPERTIVPLPSLAFNHTGGGLHCWTQQQPLGRTEPR